MMLQIKNLMLVNNLRMMIPNDLPRVPEKVVRRQIVVACAYGRVHIFPLR